MVYASAPSLQTVVAYCSVNWKLAISTANLSRRGFRSRATQVCVCLHTGHTCQMPPCLPHVFQLNCRICGHHECEFHNGLCWQYLPEKARSIGGSTTSQWYWCYTGRWKCAWTHMESVSLRWCCGLHTPCMCAGTYTHIVTMTCICRRNAC